MLKIAMISRSTLFTVRGGDTIQILETARHLRLLGVSVDVCLTSDIIDYQQYDLLHFFNIIRPADILYHIKKSKKPYVVSTIYIDYSGFDKKHRKGVAGFVFRFLSSDGIEYVKTISRAILRKDSLRTYRYLAMGQRRAIRKILKNALCLLPNSSSEYKRREEQYRCSNDFYIINHGINPALFIEKKDIERNPLLVICVARIEGIKNQLNLIKALNNTEFTLLIIGAASPNQASYYQACKNLAQKNIHFIDHVPQNELVSYYQLAKVHVLPSWFETTGLSSLEAAAMGCNIVITLKGDTYDYFGKDVFYCDPASPDSILSSIRLAANSNTNQALSAKIIEKYNWQTASEQTLYAYQKNLAS